MANEKASPGFATAEEVAALAARITAMEQLLNTKIPSFEAVGSRVSELSSAFQQANGTLAGLGSRILALETAPPAAGAEAIAELSAKIDEVIGRLTQVEQTRARGGRLSQRLASIEARLPQDGGNTNG